MSTDGARHVRIPPPHTSFTEPRRRDAFTRHFDVEDILAKFGGRLRVRNLRGALRLTSRRQWRKWLEKNHATKSEALLIIYKRAPKNRRFPSHDALEEALCFGWIDGWFKPIDDDRWVMRFSPRRKGSTWSKYNIARAWSLLNEGRMTTAGMARLPKDVLEVWKKFRPAVAVVNRVGAQSLSVRFLDGKDYLAMVNMPAKAP